MAKLNWRNLQSFESLSWNANQSPQNKTGILHNILFKHLLICPRYRYFSFCKQKCCSKQRECRRSFKNVRFFFSYWWEQAYYFIIAINNKLHFTFLHNSQSFYAERRLRFQFYAKLNFLASTKIKSIDARWAYFFQILY